MDNLTKDVIAAEKAGMSYGKWKATHPYTNPDSENYGKKTVMCKCKICGKEFEWVGRKRVACSDACYGELHRRHNRESHARMKALQALAREDEK
jgi:hypothetical protein